MNTKIIFMWLLLFTAVTGMYADNNDTDKRAAAAEEIVSIINGREWIFIPDQVQMGASLIVENLRENENYFAARGDEIDVHINVFGADFVNNMSPVKEMRVVEELMATPMIPHFSPLFTSKLKITDQEVEVSKNKKTVRVKIHYDILESNFDTFYDTHTLELTINTNDRWTSIFCNGIHYQETYLGTLSKGVYIDK